MRRPEPAPPDPIALLAVDLRFVLRDLRRPSTVVIVAALALLMGIATALFGLYRGLRDRPHEVPDIDRLWAADAPSAAAVERTWPDLPDFAAVGVAVRGTVKYSGTDTLRAAWVTPGWLEATRPPIILGRNLTAADRTRRVALISHRTWMQRFGGDSDVIGRPLGKSNAGTTVAGVVGPGFLYPMNRKRATDVWFVSDLQDQPHPALVVARALPQVAPAVAAAQLARALAVAPDKVQPFGVSEFQDQQHALQETLVAAVLLLLVICANLGTHLLGRVVRRQREHALCLAIGAEPASLVRQGVLLAAVLAVAGAVLGHLVAADCMEEIQSSFDADAISPGLATAGFDGPTLLFELGACAAVILIIALPAVLPLVSLQIHAALKASARSHSGTVGTRRAREALLALQIAVVALLAVAAGTAGAGMVARLQGLGFSSRDVIYLRAELEGGEVANPAAFRSGVLARLAEINGVEAAGLAWPEPFADEANQPRLQRITLPGEQATRAVRWRAMGGDLVRVLGIPLVKGRLPGEGSQPSEVLVDERFVEHVTPGTDPLGLRVQLHDPSRTVTIVGVLGAVKDAPSLGQDGGQPTMYLPHQLSPVSAATFVVTAKGDAEEMVARMKRVVQEIAPLKENMAGGRYRDLIVLHMLSLIGRSLLGGLITLLALVLASLGLYGAATAMVVARSNELGVRMAIGASPARIFLLLAGQGGRALAVGLLVFAAALSLTIRSDELRRLILGGDPVLWTWRWTVAALLFIVLPLLTAVAIPAYRASRTPPLGSLRYE
jgi:predicted permease